MMTYLGYRWKGDTRPFVGIVHQLVKVLHKLQQKDRPQKNGIVAGTQTWRRDSVDNAIVM